MRKTLVLIIAAVFLLGEKVASAARRLSSDSFKQTEPLLVTMNVLTQQNQVLLQHFLNLQNRFANELLTPASREDSVVSSGNMAEIACRSEDIDLVRTLLDDDAERVVKETASWAHSRVSQYDLELRGVSIEPDKASDPDRANDVVLVFHVKGAGSNALRFQADCSRKLREIGSGSEARSVACLRTDVRWM